MSNITQKWVDVLLPFSNKYSAKLSASELSRKTKIPQQTTSRNLDKLVKLNLINYLKEGKNKLFYLDLEKQTTKTILNLIENQNALQFQIKVCEATVIIDEILKNSESVIIFGSYASGKFNKNSDLDIVILGKCNKDKIKKIKNKQTIEINEHYTSYSDFVKTLNSKNPLAVEIMKNHILFGNVSKVVDIFWRKAI